jgi:cytochrome P450
MGSTVHDDMFTPNVIADPYSYYGRLRDEDPVHWNEKYELWVVTRHGDLVWMSRHHELFSSAVFKNDPRPAYPAIDESDRGLYEFVRNYRGDQFLEHDRPDHLEMRTAAAEPGDGFPLAFNPQAAFALLAGRNPEVAPSPRCFPSLTHLDPATHR